MSWERGKKPKVEGTVAMTPRVVCYEGGGLLKVLSVTWGHGFGCKA